MTLPALIALDTAGEFCSVALRARGTDRVQSEHVGARHSERLLPMLAELLGREGFELAEVDAIAFGAGPGSFTGLRIACSVAQGLAMGLGKPLIPVGNLEALAMRSLRRRAAARLVAAIDARMGEVYWAAYDAVRETGTGRYGLRARSRPALASVPELVERAAEHAPARLVLDRIDPARLVGHAGEMEALDPADAGDLLDLAEAAWLGGRTVTAEEAAPVYVRDRVALTIDERRERAAAA